MWGELLHACACAPSAALQEMSLSEAQRVELLKQLEKRQTHKAGVQQLTQLVCAVPLGDQQALSTLFPIVARVHQLLKARRCGQGGTWGLARHDMRLMSCFKDMQTTAAFMRSNELSRPAPATAGPPHQP